MDFGTGLAVMSKGVPALKAAYEHIMERRRKKAVQIIQRRMRQGKQWAVSEDETATLLIGYLKAAEEGAAAENLDLLAQVIASAQQEPTLVTARFRRWRQVLADMSREEILVLGRYIVGVMDNRNEPPPRNRLDGSVGVMRAVADLVGPGLPLRQKDEVMAYLSALQRTGIIVQSGDVGGGQMAPSPALDEIVRIVNFDEAIKAAEAVEADG